MPRVELLATNLQFTKKKAANQAGRSTILMVRKVLVDYIRDLSDMTREHLINFNAEKYSVPESPCLKSKRAVGMTDYTKKFLALADKSNNLATDDNEGPGLEVIPEEFTEETLKTVEKVIQDENLMKRIVRYNLLTQDE